MILNKLRTRLILSHALPVLILLPILGFTLLYLLESQYLLGTLADQLKDQSSLIIAFTQGNQATWSNANDAQRMIESLKPLVEARVMLLNNQGQLLASSLAKDSTRQGEFMDFPVVHDALEGKTAWQTEYNPFMGSRIVDTAVPVLDSQGQVSGIVRLSYDITKIDSEMAALGNLVWLSIFIGAIFALAVALLLARSLSQPLFKMAEAVTKLGPGHSPSSLPENGPEELSTVARSYNQVAQRLHALELGRRQFLANIVHELGTPLGAVKAASQALQHGASADPELAVELADGIGKQVDQLRLLLDDLTLLGETEIGTLSLNSTWVNMEDLVRSQCLAYAYLVKQKDIELTYHIKGNLPLLYGDGNRLGQILANLLSNAFKYTQNGGHITLSAEVQQDKFGPCIAIDVSDTGPGIAPEEQERIFEALYRSPKARNMHKGMGLGLALARRLAEAHGGSLAVESRLNQGSTFHLRLPVDTIEPEIPPVPQMAVALG